MDLPIVCTLTPEQMRQRREALTASLRALEVSTAELPDGYAFTFAATSEAFMQIAQIVDMERECCPFLNFRIVVGAGREPVRLEITGPEEAKAVIADFFLNR
jgi:hypothetical protein